MILDSIAPISSPPRRKQPAVVEALLGLAQRIGPGGKLPTARALAIRLGVTGATLTRCLEQLEARGVLRCVQGSGIYVEAGVFQKRVALVFGNNIFSESASAFGSLILKHCARRAVEHNERFSFFLDTPAFNGTVDEEKIPAHQDLSDALKQGKIDGIILMARNSVEQEVWLRSQGVPVASAESRRGAFTNNPGVVCFDYESLIQQGVKKLSQAGCRTAGLIAPLREHEEMFRSAMKEHGMSVQANCVITPPTEEPVPENARLTFCEDSAHKFLFQSCWGGRRDSKANLPDGLLITDDVMACAILPIFSNCGIRIGQDLKICSHANKGSEALAKWKSQIFRIEFDPEDMAIALFDVLEAAMAGNPLPSPHLLGPVEDQE